ncbi:FHA domain-containing protein [Hyalangium sp.]|uniref:FHA domain-containing protein n=1 Tax=Hyalangium sp. TaxID=2028555 RepID=UPI002D38FF2B|nr:FHA domain-containing protein [Hyalangium sp.]HYH98570.1 FHA domain-containing protein [Hyalangium sp.]
MRKTGTTAAAVRAAPMPFSGPKLMVSAGPKAGEEFSLEDNEYVVGRATDNPICIQDTSVSRKHIMLRRVGSGWTVSDLGSGNGTLVNGEQITDETVLANGDVITMGDTEVTFTDVANATMMVDITAGTGRSRALSGPSGVPVRPGRPERVRPGRAVKKEVDPALQKKKKMMMAGGGLVLVLAAAGLIVIQVGKQAEREQLYQEQLLQAELRKKLATMFQEAKNDIREGRYTEAKTRLLELQGMARDYPGLADYLQQVDKEIPNQEHLKAAQAALAEKKLALAKSESDKITAETTMFEQVNKLKRELAEASEAQAKEARTLLDNKQLDQARAITEDVLAVFPEHRDAKLINEEAVRLIRVRDTPVAPAPPPPTAPPWEQAAARFVDGDLSGGVALANACVSKPKCKEMLKDMTEFGNLYKKLEDLDAKGLARLLSLDKQITGSRGPSKMARNAGTRAANIFYKSASAARAAGQWARAVEYARRTVQADPGHAGASNILTELRQKAKDLYLQAYALKDGNPEDAAPKFREVIAMTPPDDETHQKAQTWLDKIQR